MNASSQAISAGEDAGACAVCSAALPVEPAVRGADLLHGTPGELSAHVCGACEAGNTKLTVSDKVIARFYRPPTRPTPPRDPSAGA